MEVGDTVEKLLSFLSCDSVLSFCNTSKRNLATCNEIPKYEKCKKRDEQFFESFIRQLDTMLDDDFFFALVLFKDQMVPVVTCENMSNMRVFDDEHHDRMNPQFKPMFLQKYNEVEKLFNALNKYLGTPIRLAFVDFHSGIASDHVRMAFRCHPIPIDLDYFYRNRIRRINDHMTNFIERKIAYLTENFGDEKFYIEKTKLAFSNTHLSSNWWEE